MPAYDGPDRMTAHPEATEGASALDLSALAQAYPENTAVSSGSSSLTYRELMTRVSEHRERLIGLEGTCALLADSSLDTLIVFHACLHFRRPLLLVPAAAPPTLQRSLIERTGASLCFAKGSWSEHCAKATADLPGPLDHVLLPTSGTTGQPKIVCLSQPALIASARAANALIGLNSQSRWALTLPYAHVGGLAILFRCALAGAAVLARDYPLASADGVRALEMDGITHLSLVPTQLRRALESGASCPKSLKGILVGGASCPSGLRARARRAAWPVTFTYGFTEAASQICTQELGRPGSEMERDVGRPLPGTEVALDGSGRISVRGPTMMNRYLGSPKRSPDEWFVTQDFGHWDEEDRLVIRGRADNMIISGGENVAAERVEDSLEALPTIREAVVFGVPDLEWGQKIAALLVGTPGPLEAIRADLREHLEAYALPKEVHFCAALPRLSSGKVDRDAARALLLALRAEGPIDAAAQSAKVLA
jgi:O-succinylbenzoic acid--CoA ligase